MDLSGPHEATPQPGCRVGASIARYFMVISVKFASTATAPQHDISDNSIPEAELIPQAAEPQAAADEQEATQEREHTAEVEQPFTEDSPHDPPDDAAEGATKPLLYVALLERKSEAPEKLQGLLAHICASVPTMALYLDASCTESTRTWGRSF